MDKTAGKLNISDWAEADRPRERMQAHGARALSDAELLAILIRSGNQDETAVGLARRILARYGNDLDRMGREVTAESLCANFKGIGQAKAVTIMAALEIGRRRRDAAAPSPSVISSSACAYEAIRPQLTDLPTEEMWVLLLNRQNRLIDKRRVGQGGIACVMCDVRVVARLAIETGASAIILAHNHPSGGNQPSRADRELTQKTADACRLLDITLNDHIIVARNTYFSFADQGLL